MNKIIKIVACTNFILVTSLANQHKRIYKPQPAKEILKEIVTLNVAVDSSHIKALNLQEKLKNESYKNHKSFLNKLAYRESSNNWKSVNSIGYIGKYQFGPIAFKDVGMNPINPVEFNSNPNIFTEREQDSLVDILINNNRKYLRNYIPVYSNKVIHGINITESGILGAAHLVGNGNVKSWLKSKGAKKIVDANGVSIEEYLVLFAHYKV